MASLDVGDPRRVAVFRALFLGDLLCALPALDALAARFPDAEVTLVGLPWARELAGRLRSIHRFEPFPGSPGLPEGDADEERAEAFLARMRAGRFDLAVQLHGSGGVTNGVVAGFRATRSIGYGPPDDGRLTAVLPWREDEHEVARWLRLVAALGASADRTRIDLPLSELDHRGAAELLGGPGAGGPVVGLHVGAKDAARRWPPERFAALGDALARRHGARLALTGGPGERPLAEALLERMEAPALDLVGRTDLGTFAAVVDRLDLLVTNDTGASHVAAATRTPSVVLFGPTSPARWAPLDRSLHTVVAAVDHVGAGVPADEALGGLPVAPVLAACERLLDPATVAAPLGLATGGHRCAG